jgi:hypothetical protein
LFLLCRPEAALAAIPSCRPSVDAAGLSDIAYDNMRVTRFIVPPARASA